jgi:hypothetical protein
MGRICLRYGESHPNQSVIAAVLHLPLRNLVGSDKNNGMFFWIKLEPGLPYAVVGIHNLFCVVKVAALETIRPAMATLFARAS